MFAQYVVYSSYMSSREQLIVQVGTTSDGKVIVAGVFRFFATHGIPLEVLMSLLSDKNVMPCWISLYREARQAGIQHSRILSRLDTAIQDAYGVEVRDEVIRVLSLLYARRHVCLDITVEWRR